MTNSYPKWAKTQLMRDYYDQHWGIPVHNEQELFMMLSLEIFQAGLSWSTIWQRRNGFIKAFAEFDVAQIAQFNEEKVEQLMADPQIIRNRRKILATINNAQVLNQLHQTGKTLEHFLWSFVNGQPIRMKVQPDEKLPSFTPLSTVISQQLKRAGFQFVGPTTVFSLMCAVGVVNCRL
ncbi:DNA-3-methyladenine glycosylase I [uncultured Limosilactobacillus sp.]|uniref:DNA-3-methyladenine glycosylase I n=1 Tax=uncultured Limosilactobacillus sp. TaxID=2837629 RepID=UPI0025FC4B33|nr:DNA-3-methyladenine glycosylase I [uncultured Limosilactobacillus sp.]